MTCPIDPSPLQPPLRTEEFETIFHLLKLATICQDLTGLLIYDFDNVDETILNYLAQQLDVLGYKGWLLADTDEKKRDLLKDSVQLHRIAATPQSIENALAILGITVIEIIENPPLTYNGTWQYNGAEFYNQKKWDRFIVRYSEPIPPELENLVFNLINTWKNARSHLLLEQCPLQYNGVWTYGDDEEYDGLTLNCSLPECVPQLQMNNDLQLNNNLQLKDINCP